MSHPRPSTQPRRELCTEVTAFIINALASSKDKVSELMFSPPEPPKDNFPRYQSLTRWECFYSADAEKSTTFAREIFRATELGIKANKDMVRLSLGTRKGDYNSVVLYTPQKIQEMFEQHQNKLSSVESQPVFGHHFNTSRTPVLMALATTDPRYSGERGQIAGTLFGKKAIDRLYPTMQKIANDLLEKYRHAAKIDLQAFSQAFAFRNILQGVIGATDVSDKEGDEFCHSLDQGVDAAATIAGVARVSLEAMLPYRMHSFADDTLADAESKMEKTLKRNEAAIRANPHSLLTQKMNAEKAAIAKEEEAKSRFRKAFSSLIGSKPTEPSVTSKDAIKQTMFAAVAGSDTSSHNITNAFVRILKDKKIYDELTKVILSYGKSPTEMKPEDYRKLSFIIKLVLEILRIDPPLPIQKFLVGPEDIVMNDGTIIKAGTHVYLNIRESNRRFYDRTNPPSIIEDYLKDEPNFQGTSVLNGLLNPEFYRNSDQFNPHRYDYLDEATINKFLQQYPENFKHHYTFQSFGRGRRMCPGRELAVFEAVKAIYDSFYYFNMNLLNNLVEEMVTFGLRPVGRDENGKEVPLEAKITPRDEKDVRPNLYPF